MKDRKLHSLKRDELLKMLLELEMENELLSRENAQLKKQLAGRTIMIERAGTLADASAQLAGLLSAAQETADIYLENVNRICACKEEESRNLIEKTREFCLSYAKRTEALGADRTGGGSVPLSEQVEALFDISGGQGG